jgi:acyl-CoA synthetase (AMP-forming)/AMP-acid ligase II
MIFLAVVGAGGVFTGTNPSYTQFELSHHIKTARASFFVSEPEIVDNLLAAAKENNIPSSNIWIFNTRGQPLKSGQRSWTELLQHGEEDWIRFDDPKICETTTAARLFSSGTTGLPKAVVLSHRNLIAQHTFVYEVVPQPFEVISPRQPDTIPVCIY